MGKKQKKICWFDWKSFQTYRLPVPDVWSFIRPETLDPIGPWLLIQSKVSFVSCFQRHIPFSNVQSNGVGTENIGKFMF